MSTRLIARVPAAAVAACLGMSAAPALAQMAPPALIGKVTSDQEGAMEGVLVSAKKEGSSITTTVVSSAKGEFAFPSERMAPGRYSLAIRAAGYVLAGPAQIDVAADTAPATAMKLTKAKNIPAQLSNGEWIMSAPGPDQVKSFLPDCVGCHTLQRVFTAMHTADEWKHPCHYLWRGPMYVKQNGDIYPCCQSYMLDGAPLGNIGEQPLESIWNSEAMESMRRLHAAGRGGGVEICSRCCTTPPNCTPTTPVPGDRTRRANCYEDIAVGNSRG